jgi:hypothetical protein
LSWRWACLPRGKRSLVSVAVQGEGGEEADRSGGHGRAPEPTPMTEDLGLRSHPRGVDTGDAACLNRTACSCRPMPVSLLPLRSDVVEIVWKVRLREVTSSERHIHGKKTTTMIPW